MASAYSLIERALVSAAAPVGTLVYDAADR
jgi:hypothetical protein